MRFSTDPGTALSPPAGPGPGSVLNRWNRRCHYYLGLYLLLFVWLFSFTGLLLNHPQWKFAEFWESRRQTSARHDIVPPASGGDLAQARDLVRQLGLRGEIDWTTTRKEPLRLDFRISRPGEFFEVQADFANRQATVRHTDLNPWGVVRILHTFTGVRLEDSRNTRDWLLTSLWAWTMDAVALGLILMVFSSYCMWFERPQKGVAGAVVLCLGVMSCGWFCFGLRWFL